MHNSILSLARHLAAFGIWAAKQTTCVGYIGSFHFDVKRFRLLTNDSTDTYHLINIFHFSTFISLYINHVGIYNTQY